MNTVSESQVFKRNQTRFRRAISQASRSIPSRLINGSRALTQTLSSSGSSAWRRMSQTPPTIALAMRIEPQSPIEAPLSQAGTTQRSLESWGASLHDSETEPEETRSRTARSSDRPLTELVGSPRTKPSEPTAPSESPLQIGKP